MITADVKYRVIYRDTDKMGVVYHANYIALYEIARNEMFRGLGIPYTDLEKMGVMRGENQLNISFLSNSDEIKYSYRVKSIFNFVDKQDAVW